MNSIDIAKMLLLLLLSVFKAEAVNPGCECILYTATYGKEYGIFSSPDFPKPYPPKIKCLLYTFIAASDEIIEIAFKEFDVDKASKDCLQGDYLKLFLHVEDAEVNEYTSWSNLLCGKYVNVPHMFYSSGPGLVLEFHTDEHHGANSSGFIGTFKFLEKRNMSAVFTYKWKGEELARLLDNGTRIIAKITIASHCNRPYTNINRTSVLFVSISFIVLMIISLAWLIFYYVQRFRYIHAKDRLSRRLCSAAKKALSKIPTKHIKGEDKEISGDGECCAICIEFYKTSDVVRILPCKHEYHKSCIDPWLLEHRTCPMCKMDILKHYGFVFTGSQESILHMDSDDVIFDTASFPSNLISPIRTSTIVPVIYSSRMLSEESRASSPNELTPALPTISSHTNSPTVFGVPGTMRAHSSIGSSPSSDLILERKPPLPSSLLRRSLSMDHIFELQAAPSQHI